MLLRRVIAGPRPAFVWLAFLLAAGLCRPAAAQLGMPPADDLWRSPTARDQLYAELAQDVELLERQANVLKRVVRLATPTVVHIDAEKSESRSGRGAAAIEETGSGIVTQHQGRFYVITNGHVVAGARTAQISIRLADGRRCHPTGVWADPGTDLAVLAVELDDLVPARLGDSSQLEIGDFVLAVGSPFGLSHSVTYGIVSAIGRRDLQLGGNSVRYQDFIQTDAAINPGNSGGPLLNLRGEVVGINTAIASNSGGSEGIGFAIPINMAMLVARQLINHGTVTRAFLGVELDAGFGADAARQAGLARLQGARVKGITPGSPAATADLQSGDIILRFDGTRIDDLDHLVNRVSLTPVGQHVELLLLRDGQPRVVHVRVGQRAE